MSDKTDEELVKEAALENAGLQRAAQSYATQIWDSMAVPEGQPAHCIVLVTKLVPDEGSPPPSEPGHRATVCHALGYAQNYGTERDLLDALRHAVKMLERRLS